MSGAAQRFDSSMAAWRQWQQAPWGRLRFTLAEANLLRHLDGLGDGPLRILDLAGETEATPSGSRLAATA
ncbi:hypothetical protein LUW77_03825 [Streptomyces radiopugnans]|nr:hypothetical protein LUW77_03825 [Streptomyces radiopugnans]